MLVSGNFFPVMGVEPELGRTFRPDEDQVPGRDAVVVLGHDFWEQQFGADPPILGRPIRLNGMEFTVIGVAPAAFTGMDQYVRYDVLRAADDVAAPHRRSEGPAARSARLRGTSTIKGRLKPRRDACRRRRRSCR